MKYTINPHKFIIYFFFFTLNFETLNTFGLGIDYLATKISFSLLFLFTLINFRYVIVADYLVIRVYIPIILFFSLLTVLNIIYRSDQFESYFNLPFFINIIILIALANYSLKDPHILLKGLFYFSLGSVLISFFYTIGIFVEKMGDGRLMMFGQNANNLGVRAAISLIIFYYLIDTDKLKFGKNRFALLLAFPLLIYLMVSTGSRVAFLSLVLGFVVLLNPFKYTITLKKAILIFITLIIAVGIWVFYLKDTYLILRLQNALFKGDLSFRDIIWENVLTIIKNHPWFGIGETGYSSEISELMGSVGSPHNVFLEVLSYTGIIGLIIFLYFLYTIFSTSYRKFKLIGDLLPLALLVPVAGMILSGQIFDQKIVWALVAFSIGFIPEMVNRKELKNSIK